MPETILADRGSGHQPRTSAVRPRGVPCTQWKRTPELHALGRALLELRARRSLSQEELGFAAHLHRNYVGALERGEINPTFRVFLKLCAGLRLPLSELIEVYERQKASLRDTQPAPIPEQMTGRRTATRHVASCVRVEPAPAQRTGTTNGATPRPRRLVR